LRKNDKQNKVKAIETTLEETLGSSATYIIFDYLERRYHLQKEDLPEKMEEFQAHLQKLLGDAAKLLINKIEEKIITLQ
jgi:hypothetical protein